ncbi:resuscitation-promoting factor [Paeniglutamicibacter cryotolerans]|uniref:Uncharacterized protein YabE (DUF348 family) n=1 Tax=Paeniglutamicibacter cryotolerans TaxID=670079 RepID=A0A839QHW0_9MICC|nr:resuscitation-promoting factor [Paeniglutamicibacter cryotolerans]MBB2995968.1 uncharacterized protein YabE (DUF348 family) [Paeniglutamicibacter cryotolerans]
MQTVLKNRWFKLGAQATVLTALILGLVTFVGGGKTIALTIDGQTQSVDTRAKTVADVLAASEVILDEDDVVSPALDAPAENGGVIEVSRNKAVKVSIDGVDRVVHTTGLTVADVVEQLKLDQGADIDKGNAMQLASLSAPIEISTPKAVTITADGKKKKTTTTAATVAEALAEADVTLGQKDKLSVKASAAIAEGLEVKVIRVKTVKVTETEVIAKGEDKVKDKALLIGSTKVLEPGQDGERTLTYAVITHDGKQVSKKLTDTKVTTKAEDRTVAVGTKAKPTPAKSKRVSTPGSVSGAWAGLAKCESGGNWAANTGNGYYGGLQFSASSWRGAGGTKYAALPHLATPAQQIATAEKLRSNGGWGHWPHCSSKLGLR